MRNVLYLINHAGQAGTERYVLGLAEAARAHGYSPHFAYNEGGALSERIAALRVPSERIEMRGPFDMRAARALGAYCRAARIDVVHTGFLRENYVALLARLLFCRRVKVVYTNHVMLANPWPIKAANRLMTRGNHRIIAVCGAARDQLVKNGNDARKIAVIHNAVDPAEWRPGDGRAEARAAARAKYAIAGDATVFLCASRFSPEKGHRFLLEAFALLAGGAGMASGVGGAASRACLLLAGDGPLLGETRALAASLGIGGSVRFAGHVGDMKPMYVASDACVCPSESEASSYMILEALASGLPVIATDRGGNGEIVNEGYGNGLLVGYGDAAALRDAMLALCESGELRLGMGKSAMRAVEDHFSLGNMLDRTFETYR
jgi:glycosyltransferase involved in cell wall biosynthesis